MLDEDGANSIPLARLRREKLLKLALDPVKLLAVGRAVAFLRDVGPERRIFGVDFQPLIKPRLRVRLDRVGGAFRLADAAVDAFVRMDDEHVLALVETVHRADFDAVHIFAFYAIVGDDIGHLNLKNGFAA
jgi:hypothetical protein